MTDAVDTELRAQLIVDHARNPVGRTLARDAGEPGPGQRDARGYTPSCGDEVLVRVTVDAQGRVSDVAWTGHGCTVSQAGASMVAALVAEAPVASAELAVLLSELQRATPPGGAGLDETRFGDASALGGGWLTVQRARCASLAAAAVLAALPPRAG